MFILFRCQKFEGVLINFHRNFISIRISHLLLKRSLGGIYHLDTVLLVVHNLFT